MRKYSHIKKLTTYLLLLNAISLQADELDSSIVEQQLKEKNMLLQEIELNKKISGKSISKTCLTAPLPSTPKTPNYKLTYSEYAGTTYEESIDLIFWRERCTDNTGSALLVRAKPIVGNMFLCSGYFKIIQNNNQINNIKLLSTPESSSWCDDLFIDTTLIVDQNNYDNTTFNPANALTIIYKEKKLDIPLAIASTPNINGAVFGHKNYKFNCKNNRTGEIKFYPSQTNAVWECKGLTVKSGDTVITSIFGTVK